MVAIIWALVSISQSGLAVAILRASPLDRCWVILPNYRAQGVFATVNTSLAAVLILSMTTLIFSHAMGRACWGWLRFWYRRNWVLVSISVLRGLVFVRPGFPLSDLVGSLINYSIFLCCALSIIDLVLILVPSGFLKVAYGFYIASQIVASITSYLTGSSLDAPCDDSRSPRSAAWFIIGKVQTSALLFHSLYYLQLLVRFKIFEGIAVPIINFSEDRFSQQSDLPKHRIKRLETATADGAKI